MDLVSIYAVVGPSMRWSHSMCRSRRSRDVCYNVHQSVHKVRINGFDVRGGERHCYVFRCGLGMYFIGVFLTHPPSRVNLSASGRCAKGNAKNLELSDLSVQGHNGFLLAQGKNCLARGQGALRNSADMQASCQPCGACPV